MPTPEEIVAETNSIFRARQNAATERARIVRTVNQTPPDTTGDVTVGGVPLDSGRRAIPADPEVRGGEPPESAPAVVYLRRWGPLVTLQIEDFWVVSSNSTVNLLDEGTLPSGFGPAYKTTAAIYSGNVHAGTLDFRGSATDGPTTPRVRNLTETGPLHVEVTYVTNDPWPDPLPGDPA